MYQKYIREFVFKTLLRYLWSPPPPGYDNFGVLIPNEIKFLPFSFSFSTNLAGIFTCEELDNPFFLSPVFWPSDSLLPLQYQHWHQSFQLFAKLAYPNIIFNVSKDTRNFQTFSSTILVISPKLPFQSCYFFCRD